MKYIRIENNVYENNNDLKVVNNHLYMSWWNSDDVDDLGEVIQQADTIEKLCDGFIIKENHHVVQCFLKKDGWTLDDVIHMPKVETYEVVGFIETESGLNYVAKMNKKRELELI